MADSGNGIDDEISEDALAAFDEFIESLSPEQKSNLGEILFEMNPQSQTALQESLKYYLEDVTEAAFDEGFETAEQFNKKYRMLGRHEDIHAYINDDSEKLTELIVETAQFCSGE